MPAVGALGAGSFPVSGRLPVPQATPCQRSGSLELRIWTRGQYDVMWRIIRQANTLGLTVRFDPISDVA